MLLSVSTSTLPPAETALIPDETLRVHVGNVEADDAASIAVLRDHILSASAKISRWLGQPLGQHSVTDEWDLAARQRRRWYLPLSRPLNARVTNVAVDGTPLGVTDYAMTSSLLFRRGSTRAWDYERITATYSTGWPVTAGAIQVPDDLRYACLVMAGQQWYGREHSPDLRMAQLSGVFAAGYDPPGLLPSDVFEVLESYRRGAL